MENIKDLELKVYAVRNTKGLFFRSKGYGGYGENWVKDLKDAKIYLKIGTARRVVTFYNNLENKDYGAPELIQLTLSNAIVLDETNRLVKAKIKKQKDVLSQKINNAERKLRMAKDELDRLGSTREEVEKLKKELQALNGN